MKGIPFHQQDLDKLYRALYMYGIINPKMKQTWYDIKTKEEIYIHTSYDWLFNCVRRWKITVSKYNEMKALADKLYQKYGFDKLEKMIRKKV